MNKNIVTVETNFGREVICTMNEVEDTDKHYRHTEITSYEEACAWIRKMSIEFPHSVYHLYMLTENTIIASTESTQEVSDG